MSHELYRGRSRGPGLSLRAKVLILLVLVGLAEAGVRLFSPAPQPSVDPYDVRYETASGVPIFHETGMLALRRDPDMGVVLAPDQVLAGSLPDGRRATVKVNAQGFRGDDWTPERAPGVYRVIVVGGSCVFGTSASSDQTTIPAHLQKLLAPRLPEGRKVEVWNAGVPGYDARQELQLTAARLLEYRPDAIVVVDGWNDFCRSFLAPTGTALSHPIFLEEDDLAARQKDRVRYVLRSLALYRAIEGTASHWGEERTPALGGSGDPKSFFGARTEFPDRPDAAVRYYRSMQRLAQLCKGAGVRFVFATQPEIWSRGEPLPVDERAMRGALPAGYADLARRAYPRWAAAARTAAIDHGGAFVDAREAFRGTEERAFLAPVRLTDRGNELVAEMIAPELLRLLTEEEK